MNQGARILVVAALAVFAGAGAALALGDGDPESPVPTTGRFTQTTDPSREDYWDQIEYEVPINRIAEAAESAFGPKFGDIAIDRGVEPDVLRVYVVNATPHDEAVLARIADDHPQVVLQPADFTWEQLLTAKEAVADIAADEDLGDEARSFGIAPDLVEQRVSVTSTRDLSHEVKVQIRAAASHVPVAFAFGPEYLYELLASP